MAVMRDWTTMINRAQDVTMPKVKCTTFGLRRACLLHAYELSGITSKCFDAQVREWEMSRTGDLVSE